MSDFLTGTMKQLHTFMSNVCKQFINNYIASSLTTDDLFSKKVDDNEET